MAIVVRPGRPDDGPTLQQIERLAGLRFREVGLDRVAEDEPRSVEALAAYAIGGRTWVAADETDRPVGYVIVDVVDGAAHIEQLSVAPDHQGVGVGRALIDQVRAWAAASGRSAITLTTFAEVPWNGPLYRHLGFQEMADNDVGHQLRGIRDAETAYGLDAAAPRICMKFTLER